VNERRFYEQASDDQRRIAPAVERNVGPIAAVLAEWLPPRGLMLELASGTGQHAVAFAARFPDLHWQPSDSNADALRSIAAWREDCGAANLFAPLNIDAAVGPWPILAADAVVAINLVHISPWATALSLVENAARLLPPGAPLILYGPWIVEGTETAMSDLAFDADLRLRDPAWGLREVNSFAGVAADYGLDLCEQRVMPANNLMLLWRRR
jgi:Protein of unknown function (DUF938)